MKHKDDKDKGDRNIIGQFGVGFYSAFMVAKKIEVTTKKRNGKAYRFTSDGIDSYSIEDVDSFDKDSGTDIKVYLKDDNEEENFTKYLGDFEIEELVKKYSDYVRYPIRMEETHVSHEYDKDGKVIPEIKRKPLAFTAWEYGPTAFGALGVFTLSIIFRLLCTSKYHQAYPPFYLLYNSLQYTRNPR